MSSIALRGNALPKRAGTRRKAVVRVPKGATVVYTTGNPKYLDATLAQWSRTRKFHQTTLCVDNGIVSALRQARDNGLF